MRRKTETKTKVLTTPLSFSLHLIMHALSLSQIIRASITNNLSRYSQWTLSSDIVTLWTRLLTSDILSNENFLFVWSSVHLSGSFFSSSSICLYVLLSVTIFLFSIKCHVAILSCFQAFMLSSCCQACLSSLSSSCS